MVYSVLRLVLNISNTFAAIFGSLPNLFVIYLCFSLPKGPLQGTRWYLSLQCTLEFINCILLTGLQFALYEDIDDRLSILIIGYLNYLPVKVTASIQALYTFLIVLSILTLPLGFIYRYSYICRSRLKAIFRFHIIAAVISLLAIIDAAFILTLFPRLNYRKMPLNDTQLLNPNEKAIKVSFTKEAFCIVLVLCAFLVIVSIAAYTIITITTKRIVHTVRSGSSSNRMRAMQKQLSIAMVLQAMIPLTFTTLPLLAFIILFFVVKIAAVEYASLILALIHWQPCAHPALYLLFVRQFRKKLLLCNCSSSLFNSNVIPIFHLHS